MNSISVSFVKFPKCPLLNNRNLIGIDIGCFLTKFVFLDKNHSDELFDNSIDHVTLQYAIFDNENTETSLKWLKEQAFILDDKSLNIRGTGVSCIKYRKTIEEIFHLKLEFVDKNSSTLSGHRMAFERIGIKNLRYPPPSLDNIKKFVWSDELTKTLDKFKEKIHEKDSNNDFPCLVYFCGSSFIYFDENGEPHQEGSLDNCGKLVLGLAKCLLDTNDYDEIMDLAKRGDRGNVDTQIKDVLFENSPYGSFPEDLPVISFGKSGDLNKGLDQFSREDIAAALIYFYCSMITAKCNTCCVNRKLSKIYFSGNIFQSDVMRNYLQISNEMYWMPIGLEYIVLDSGFCPAIGAMLLPNEEIK